MPTINFDLKSDSSDLEKDLKAVSKGLKKVEDAYDDVGKASNAASKQQAKNSKKTKKDTKEATDNLGGMKDAAEGVGGSIGGMAGQIEKFAMASGKLGPVALAVGAITIAAAGAAVAVVKLGQAFVGAVRSSGEVLENLEKLGAIDILSDEEVNKIKTANAELDVLGTILGTLGAQFTSIALGETFDDFAKAMIIFGLVTIDVFNKLTPFIIQQSKDWIDFAFNPMGITLLKVLKGFKAFADWKGIPLPEGTQDFIDTFEKGVSKTEQWKQGMTDLIEVSGKYGEEADRIIGKQLKLNEGVDKNTKAVKLNLSWLDLLAQRLEERSQKEADAQDEINKIRLTAASDLEQAITKRVEEHAKALERIEEIEKEGLVSAEEIADAKRAIAEDLASDRVQLEKDAAKEIADAKQKAAAEDLARTEEGYQGSISAMVDFQEVMGGLIAAAFEFEKNLSDEKIIQNENERDTIQEKIDNQADDAARANRSLTDAEIANRDRWQTEMEAIDARTKAIKKEQFARDKEAAIASSIINTLAGIGNAFATNAWPVALGISVALSALGTASVATIASQPNPYPHGGIIPQDIMSTGSSDHGLISAMPGESVLNKRATRNLGLSGVNNLNSGNSMGGQIVVQNVYKHRTFDVFVQDNIKKGGPLSDAINTGRSKVGKRN